MDELWVWMGPIGPRDVGAMDGPPKWMDPAQGWALIMNGPQVWMGAHGPLGWMFPGQEWALGMEGPGYG